MDVNSLFVGLTQGLAAFTWGNALMITVGLTLIALAILKEYEPVLLLPIGFGCILANNPLSGMNDGEGLFGVLYRAGISTELFPLLIFIGVGAMIDFSPQGIILFWFIFFIIILYTEFISPKESFGQHL